MFFIDYRFRKVQMSILMPQSHIQGSTPRFYYGVFSMVDTGKFN